MTKAAIVMELLNNHPHWPNAKIAEKAGCHVSYAYMLRKKMVHVDEPLEPTEEMEVDAVDTVLDERGSRYGSFEEKALFIQGMKKLMRYTPNWDALPADTREALEMIVHKIGRVTHGDAGYLDNFVDIAGYARLVADRLEGRSR